jgi:hypothetical protein
MIIITDALHEDLCTRVIICRSVLLRMRNISDKIVIKIRTHILYSVTFIRISCRLWGNVEKYVRSRQVTDDNIIRCMRVTCWITKATYTHSGYAIILAFSQQQWLRERDSILHYTCIAYVVNFACDFCRQIWASVFAFQWQYSQFCYCSCLVNANWL